MISIPQAKASFNQKMIWCITSPVLDLRELLGWRRRRRQ